MSLNIFDTLNRTNDFRKRIFQLTSQAKLFPHERITIHSKNLNRTTVFIEKYLNLGYPSIVLTDLILKGQ